MPKSPAMGGGVWPRRQTELPPEQCPLGSPDKSWTAVPQFPPVKRR